MSLVRYYPLALDLKNKSVLVVGAGKVAERKIASLLLSQARVLVVAPKATIRLLTLARKKKIKLLRRRFRISDIKSSSLVIAATSDSKLNRQVSRVSRESGIPVNVVDNPVLCDYICPAVLRKGKALITVYTDALDPVLSRDLKNFLKENWSVFLSYRSRL